MCGRSWSAIIVSGSASCAFRNSSCSIVRERVYELVKVSPRETRFCTMICRLLYQALPMPREFSVMSPNSGYGRSSSCRWIVAPLRVVSGSSPANGFGTCA